MLSQTVIKRLKEIIGEKNVVTDKVDLFPYSYGFCTLLSSDPLGVVSPQTTEQVVELVKYLNEQNIKVIPRGAGTNVIGGAIPAEESVVISFTRMNKILEIDTENFITVVQPGVVNFDLQLELEKRGFYYPPDPSSAKVATLGGNLAESSGGARCFKYGVTRDYILGVEVVLPNGKVINTGGRNFKSEPGYDLTRILNGSEGTLGLVTKIILRVLPLPPTKRMMLAVYNQVEEAAQTVNDIFAAGIAPATLEMLDNFFINTTEDFCSTGIPRDAGAALIIEIDGYPEDMNEQVRIIGEITRKAKARDFKIARSMAEVEQILTPRRVGFGSVASITPSYSINDIAVPRSNFSQAFAGIQKIAKDFNVKIGVLAHAGDGNFHPFILFDQRDKEEVERVHAAEQALCEMALSYGGTITGEQGVGITKRKHLDKQFKPEAMEAFRKIKKSFDPQNRFNPGKIFDI